MNKHVAITIQLIFILLFFSSGSEATEWQPFEFKSSEPSPIKKIVIDPGYGGNDEGPLCKSTGLKTKDINLLISKKLAQDITNKLNIKAILTRSDDTSLLLEERTAIANIELGDLFISIHTNSSGSLEAHGIETYIMNARASDKYAEEIKYEKNTLPNKFSVELENIFVDMKVKNKVGESKSLATYIQQSMFDTLNPKYSHIKNRGVKRAPFYVLIGANMPSIVVATGFVSNPRECKRLASDKYQNDLAMAISLGVEKYIDEFNKDR